jgi:ribosome-binding factor A
VSKRRQARIADVIQRELSDIVQRRIKDPRLVGLTITGARVSADYMYADIYFYRLGADQDGLTEAREGLESASGFIRRELGARLRTRFTPELRFHLDESIDYGDHIDALLHQIQEERHVRLEPGGPSEEARLEPFDELRAGSGDPGDSSANAGLQPGNPGEPNEDARPEPFDKVGAGSGDPGDSGGNAGLQPGNPGEPNGHATLEPFDKVGAGSGDPGDSGGNAGLQPGNLGGPDETPGHAEDR